MQRYFVDAKQFHDGLVVLDGDEAHHLIRVMRARPGDQIIVSNGLDREVLAEITMLHKDTVETRIVEQLTMNHESYVRVTVAQSLPKGDKFETVIQKGTELGADAFIPFTSQRTIVQYDARKEAKRLERWRKIAKEAAEQAHRNRVPHVAEAVRWANILQLVDAYDLVLMCYEQVDQTKELRPLLQQFRSAYDERYGRDGRQPSILLIVGPEGGFADQEAEQAAATGIQLVGLGRRILRTETAAMVGLACIMYEFNEMGGAL